MTLKIYFLSLPGGSGLSRPAVLRSQNNNNFIVSLSFIFWEQGKYPVMNFRELDDIDLNSSFKKCIALRSYGEYYCQNKGQCRDSPVKEFAMAGLATEEKVLAISNCLVLEGQHLCPLLILP